MINEDLTHNFDLEIQFVKIMILSNLQKILVDSLFIKKLLTSKV